MTDMPNIPNLLIIGIDVEIWLLAQRPVSPPIKLGRCLGHHGLGDRGTVQLLGDRVNPGGKDAPLISLGRR
jgi:hypothetical protein